MQVHQHRNPSSEQRAGSTPLIIGAVVLLVLFFVAWPCFVRAPVTASKNACINNLRQLDGAKEQWGLENKMTQLSSAKDSEVLAYVKGGVMPICSVGGKYVINYVGLPPYCSDARHTLLYICKDKLDALNNAAKLWFLQHPSATSHDLVLSDLFGFGKALLQRPECELGGRYSFNRKSAVFQCSVCGAAAD